MKNYFFFVLFILAFQRTIIPQNELNRVERFTIENGLSQNTVLCILQDHRGFLWLGTNDGLNRYDGYNFIKYRHNPSDSGSLSGNRIYSLCEDAKGNLWVGTYGGGLDYYLQDKDIFIKFLHDTNNPNSLSSNEVTSVLEDKSGNIWVGTNGSGLNRFDRQQKIFIHYLNSPHKLNSISDNNVNVITEDSSGYLWIGTSHGLNQLDTRNNHFTHFYHNDNDGSSLSDNEVLSICHDRKGTMWVGTGRGGLNKFDGKNKRFIHFRNIPGDPQSLSANRVYSIYEDRLDNLWVGTIGGGLDKLDRETGEFTRYWHDPGNPESLSSNSIFSIYEDISGVLWVGTYNDGLNKINNYENKRFYCYKNNHDDPWSLSNNKVYSIYQDREKNIWIGTGGGLNKFEPVKKRFIKYPVKGINNPSGSYAEVLAIDQDRNGVLWMGVYEKGLIGIDNKKNKVFTYENEKGNKNSLSSNKIFSIYEDHEENLWIGTDDGGLNKLNKQRNNITRYLNDPDDNSSLGSNRVFAIFEDDSNVLWVGTDGGGLNRYNKKTDDFSRYLHNPDDPGSISSNSILSINEDHMGNLWIGTYGGGLNKFNRKKKQFKNYRGEDGLPNDVIYGILEDNSGNLWLSTNNGLSEFNIESNTCKNYDVRDGLQGNEFNQGAYFKNKEGEMFFGGTDGINIFYPDSIKDNPHIPPVVITNFEIAYKTVSIGMDTSFKRLILKKSISETNSIQLEHGDNIISFEFAALDFQCPAKNKYNYILDGFDKEWHQTDSHRRFATYTNLDPGKYTFYVKGSNNDGIWNNKGAMLEIIINPPWWSTWWAYTLYAILFISVFATSTRLYVNRQKLKEELKLEQQHAQKLAEVDKMKSNFFTNVSHEFRTPLTLITGPTDNIINNSADMHAKSQAEVIKRNAGRLLRLINQLLDLSKLDEKKLKLHVTEGNIVSFIKGIVMSFESFAERKDINLKIKSSKNEIILLFDRAKMENIITNLLSNAIKFTSAGGNVDVIIVDNEDDLVEIKVKDSGIGIPEDEIPKLFDRFHQVDSSQTREYEGSGLGLALTKELVELHHGTISVKSKECNRAVPNSGWTEFTIHLPRGKYQVTEDELLKNKEVEENYENDLAEREYFTYSDKTESKGSDNINNNDTIILIVEDNKDVRDYISEFLSVEYTIVEAFNGEHGVRKAKDLIPDLIISDIMMPKMDGNELTKILKNDEKTSHIPIILLTAKSEQESRYRGLEEGADDYLIKPFDSKELRLRVKNLIDVRRKIHQKFSDGGFSLLRTDKSLSRLDQNFINKINDTIEKHLAEEKFSIEEMSNEINMSHSQLHRKLKALTGKSASTYLRSIRLGRAKKMIIEQQGNISEIAYSVGFSSPAYFTKCFKDEFGIPPSRVT